MPLAAAKALAAATPGAERPTGHAALGVDAVLWLDVSLDVLWMWFLWMLLRIGVDSGSLNCSWGECGGVNVVELWLAWKSWISKIEVRMWFGFGVGRRLWFYLQQPPAD